MFCTYAEAEKIAIDNQSSNTKQIDKEKNTHKDMSDSQCAYVPINKRYVALFTLISRVTSYIKFLFFSFLSSKSSISLLREDCSISMGRMKVSFCYRILQVT